MNHETLTAEAVINAALEYGADLCTIGSIGRWKATPKNESPLSIMPRAKSVICIAFRIQRGALRGAVEGTYFSAYSLANFNDINEVIAPTVQRRLTNFIESYGYEAVPIQYYSHNLGRNTGKAAVDEQGREKPAPEVFFNFRIGGYLCGMGQVGHSRMLLTREFGPAQRLYFIVTEAELQENPLVNDICDKCMECVRHCPAHALEKKADDNVDIPGISKIERSGLNDTRCRLAHISGAFSPYASPEIREYAEYICGGENGRCADGAECPPFSEIQKKVTAGVSYAANMDKMFHAPSALCGEGCMIACLRHLDRKGALSRKFRHPF